MEEGEEMGFSLVSHHHALRKVYKIIEDEEFYCCRGCQRGISDCPVYKCAECRFVVHCSCAALPRFLFHPLHAQHPLFLYIRTVHDWNRIQCNSCSVECFGFTYRCHICDYDLDLECADQLPSVCSSDVDPDYRIDHFSHRHPLIAFSFGQVGLCYGCALPIEDGEFYGCNTCLYFLHKSCAELPSHIRHPFHVLHPLTLRLRFPQFYRGFVCSACDNTRRGFSYGCSACKFELDLHCAKLIPFVKSEKHTHPLTLVSDIGGFHSCAACRRTCRGKVFRCMGCNFTLHLQCGPLPLTVNHKCHVDPLVLTDSVVDDDDYLVLSNLNVDDDNYLVLTNHGMDGDGDDDSLEFYCDACERKRDPKDRVYHCEECKFVAHIECVIFDVMPLTKEVESLHDLMTVVKEKTQDGSSSLAQAYNRRVMNLISPSKPVTRSINSTVARPMPHLRNRPPVPLGAIEENRAAEQESGKGPKEAEPKATSASESLLCNSTSVNEIIARGSIDEKAITSEKSGEDVADEALIKLDEQIAKLNADVEAQIANLKELSKNLEALKMERARHVSSTTLDLKRVITSS